jgi:hypothetical protein
MIDGEDKMLGKNTVVVEQHYWTANLVIFFRLAVNFASCSKFFQFDLPTLSKVFLSVIYQIN